MRPASEARTKRSENRDVIYGKSRGVRQYAARHIVLVLDAVSLHPRLRQREYSLTGIFSLADTRRVTEEKRNPDLDTTTLVALAEPNRKRIVELLRDGPLTVGEIADRLGMRQPQASKHLKVLNESGILEVRAEANRRIYQLRPEPFQMLDAWAQSFRQAMAARFDNLDEYLRKIQEKGEKP